MPYTTEEGGLLNNWPNEPKMYEAEPNSQSRVRNLLLAGTGGIALISALIYVAFSVS